MLFKFDADYDRVRWYGLGPEETYADRLEGARLGLWEKRVSECLAHYPRPQESGNHCGVRRLQILDLKGRGVEFTGDNLSVNVLPWTPHEVESAAHEHELPPVHYTGRAGGHAADGRRRRRQLGCQGPIRNTCCRQGRICAFSFCFRGI